MSAALFPGNQCICVGKTKIMKKLLSITVGAGVALGMSAASAQDYNGDRPAYGPYISAGYNYLDFDEDLGGDASVSALTARAGWRFARIFAVEGDISFGIDNGDFDFNADEDDLDFDDNNDSDFDDVIAGPGDLGLDYLIGGYGRIILPLGDRFDVSARAGYAFAEIDSTVATLGGNDLTFGGSDSGFAFGASASYYLSQAVSLRADYTHYEFDDANAESLGVNLVFNFGG